MSGSEWTHRTEWALMPAGHAHARVVWPCDTFEQATAWCAELTAHGHNVEVATRTTSTLTRDGDFQRTIVTEWRFLK